MSEKNTSVRAQAALERAHHVLAVLEGASTDWRTASGIDLDTYRQSVSDLGTTAASVEVHLTALEALLPEVRRQTRELSHQNKKAARTLVRALHGRPPHRNRRRDTVEAAVETPPATPPAKPRTGRAKAAPPGE